MPARPSVDPAPQQPDSRPKHGSNPRLFIQDVEEGRGLAKTRREIGVEVADIRSVVAERFEKPAAHRFGLTAVLPEGEKPVAAPIEIDESPNHLARTVRAAVVYEEERDSITLEGDERLSVEAFCFVVARDHEDDRRCRSTACRLIGAVHQLTESRRSSAMRLTPRR